MKKFSVVIPVFNSEQSLNPLTTRLIKVLEEINNPYEIVFVDDCSQDRSWNTLKALKTEHGTRIKIAKLLVNSGQHNAILCGFSMSSGDIVITMDDDLQNPPEEIPKLIKAIEEGYDLVIGAYSKKKHSLFRNWGGRLIDRIQRKIFNLSDQAQLNSFRATKKAVVDNVNEMAGTYPYITSMLLANASKFTNVDVRHDKREHGTSNYTLKRSAKLALNLIFHYSSYPIYAIASICAFALLFSLGFGIWTLIRIIQYGSPVQGWASTILSITFFSSLILFCLLLFGIYLSRLHHQITRFKMKYKIDEIHE